MLSAEEAHDEREHVHRYRDPQLAARPWVVVRLLCSQAGHWNSILGTASPSLILILNYLRPDWRTRDGGALPHTGWGGQILVCCRLQPRLVGSLLIVCFLTCFVEVTLSFWKDGKALET